MMLFMNLAPPKPQRVAAADPASSTAQYSCQNISLYEPEQSLSLSQDEKEQC